MRPADERALAKARGLTQTARNVLLALATFTDLQGRCFPRRAQVAALAGCSEKTVTRALAELEGRGLLTREERRRADGGRTSDLYTLALLSTSAKVEKASESTRKLPLMTVMRPVENPVENHVDNRTPPGHRVPAPPGHRVPAVRSPLKMIDSNSDEHRRRRAEVAPLLAELAQDMGRKAG